MRRFFCENISESAAIHKPDKGECRHIIQTLRMKVGDELLLMDGFGHFAEAVIKEIQGRNGVICELQKVVEMPRPDFELHLFVAPPSNGTTALILKQAVELGVHSVYLMSCRYSVSKSKKEKNVQAELIAAAKQSGNPWLPKIYSGLTFDEALKMAPEHNFYGAVPEDDFYRPSEKINKAGLWIGPEGGFADYELDRIQNLPATPMAVGPYILRVETAVNSVCSVLLSKYGGE